MGVYRSPLDIKLPGTEWHYLPYLDQLAFLMTHRDVRIIEYVDREDCITFNAVIEIDIRLKKEVDYYLDAIWC